MKQTILLISFALLFSDLSAQQDAQFSQNMFNKLANNPGFAGSNQAISAYWACFVLSGQVLKERHKLQPILSIHAPVRKNSWRFRFRV